MPRERSNARGAPRFDEDNSSGCRTSVKMSSASAPAWPTSAPRRHQSAHRAGRAAGRRPNRLPRTVPLAHRRAPLPRRGRSLRAVRGQQKNDGLPQGSQSFRQALLAGRDLVKAVEDDGVAHSIRRLREQRGQGIAPPGDVNSSVRAAVSVEFCGPAKEGLGFRCAAKRWR